MTINSPSWEKQQLLTHPSWYWSTMGPADRKEPDDRLYTFTVLSQEVVARYMLLCEKAHDVTAFVWLLQNASTITIDWLVLAHLNLSRQLFVRISHTRAVLSIEEVPTFIPLAEITDDVIVSTCPSSSS